jgi:CheY-like chemotaxis protein
MTEEISKQTVQGAGEKIDYSGRPFGYITPDTETAMICEQDPVIRDKIVSELKKMGFATVQPGGFKEALKFMRFHVFNVIFIDEDFDTGVWETNNVLRYLENLNMSVRRQIFVVLVSTNVATMDNLEAYARSVNLIINKRDILHVGKLLRQAMTENNEFYQIFKERLQK